MKTSVPCLSGLQVIANSSAPPNPVNFWALLLASSDDQNGVLTGADDFGDVIGAVGQADRNRKVDVDLNILPMGIGRDIGRSVDRLCRLARWAGKWSVRSCWRRL